MRISGPQPPFPLLPKKHANSRFMGWDGQHFTLKTKAGGPTNPGVVYLGCRGGSGGLRGKERKVMVMQTVVFASFQSRRLDCHSTAILRTHTGCIRKCQIWEIFAEEWPGPQKMAAHTVCRLQDRGSRTTLPPASCGILKSLHLSKPQVSDSQMTTIITMAHGVEANEMMNTKVL